MIRRLSLILPLLLLLGLAEVGASDNLWRDVTPAFRQVGEMVTAVRYYEADEQGLRDLLRLAPHESTGDRSLQIELPLPNGKRVRVSVLESPILTPEGAALYPEAKSFRVYGADGHSASGRIGMTSRGFHGILQTNRGTVYLDLQDAAAGNQIYRARYKHAAPGRAHRCGVHDVEQPIGHAIAHRPRVAHRLLASRTASRRARRDCQSRR